MKTKLLFFLMLSIITLAQVVDKKWSIIQDLEDRIVYIDTSNLKMMNNQISVWTNIYYRTPIELSPFQPKARSVRSQFLINPVTRKFQVIGSIYYDDKGTMVSESSNSRFGIGNFQSNIDDVPGMEVVLNKSQEFLNNGSVSSEPSEVDFTALAEKQKEETPITTEPKDSLTTEENKNGEFYRINKSGKVVYSVMPDISKVNETQVEDNTQIKFENDIPEPVVNDSLTVNYDTSTENLNEQVTTPIEIAPTPAEIPEPVIEEKPEETIPEKIEPITNSDYNLENEQSSTNTIFTDGNLYVVQVSSWKTDSVAEKEKEKLQNMGYNAFIHEVYIESKRSTYNRVRVGYFTSLDEAKETERKIKKGN